MNKRRVIQLATVGMIAVLVIGCDDTPVDPDEVPPVPETPLTFGTGLIAAPTGSLGSSTRAAAAVFSGSTLPGVVDLTGKLPPVGNQGMQNSCVGWATAYGLKTYQEFVEENLPLRNNAGGPNTARVFSPAFVYNQINQGRDEGSLFRDAFAVLQSQGAATLADMPYFENNFRVLPTAAVTQRAARYRIEYYRWVPPDDHAAIKSYLNAGTPVVIGAALDQAFQSLPRGAIWRSYQGPVRGKHAMLVVGYDDTRRAFRVLNSWGTGWSDGGLGWIDYTFFTQAVTEAYIAKDAPNGGPAPGPIPGPAPIERASFGVNNVVHNQVIPGAPSLGMIFQGNLSVPPGAAGRAQVVVYFHFALAGGGRGAAVAARLPQYSTVYGTAATGTAPINVNAAGLVMNWTAALPYFALSIPPGSGPVSFVAEPVLFIDNFPVKNSALIPFFAVF